MLKSPCILLNKNKNFNNNETESKIENPTQTMCFSWLVQWPCRMTLAWSAYRIFWHFLLIWSKWIPKRQACPSQVPGKIFYGPLKMRYVKNRKNSKIFVKNDQNPLLFVLVGKKIVCRSQKCCWSLLPPMKVKSYNRKTPVFAKIYRFCRKIPIRNRFSKKLKTN